MADQILRPEHLATLNRVLDRIQDTKSAIDRAERAGVPMEQAKQELEEQKKLAEGLKREFFPEAT